MGVVFISRDEFFPSSLFYFNTVLMLEMYL